MKLKFWHGAVIGSLIALFFIMDGCKAKRDLTNAISEINNYKDSVMYERTENGQLLSYNKNLKISEEALFLAIDSLNGYIDNIDVSDPEVITIIETELQVDSILIPIYLTDCEFDTTFTVDSTNYNIDVRITNEGLTFNSLRFPNTMGLVIGYKKEKWWKRKERVATVTNTNPYMNVQGISSFTIEDDRKWFQKGWVKVVGGIVIGGVTTYTLIK